MLTKRNPINLLKNRWEKSTQYLSAGNFMLSNYFSGHWLQSSFYPNFLVFLVFWHKIKHTLNHQMKPKIKMLDYYFTRDGTAGHESAMTE